MYAKVFHSVFEGSMRGKPDVLLVWFNMLAHSPYGTCDRTIQTISDEIGISIERVEAAIAVLEAPDPDSRSPDEEGRRIVRLSQHRSWGWKLVNWEFYRALINECDRRAKESDRQRRHREKKLIEEIDSQVVDTQMVSRSVTDCHALSQNVTFRNASASVHSSTVKVPTKEEAYSTESRVALHWLNQESGRSFREMNTSLGPIHSRLKEPGVDLEGVKRMITRQCKLWKGTKLEEYLRPSTLFGKEKFNEYYAAKDQPTSQSVDRSNPRNAGTITGPTDYGKSKPRLQRELEAKTGMAGQMALPSVGTSQNPTA